jgi:ELWxxDGT repeat protein
VKDVRTGASGSNPQSLTAVGGTLYFAADDGTNGVELWKSAGTGASTQLVENINPAGDSSPMALAPAGDKLFFAANDGTNGSELWTSDGTVAGTALVKNLNPTASASPRTLRTLGGALLFVANDGVKGDELWKLALASGCGLVGSTLRISLVDGGSVTVGRLGTSFNVTGNGIGDPTCGGATVNNVDSVEIAGSDQADSLTINLAGGQFAPGLTPEATGVSEIEFTIDLGDGSDTLIVQGGTAVDKLVFGTTGANVTGDSDADLTLTAIEAVTLLGADGNDTLSGGGASGTGNPFTKSLTLRGEGGSDKLTGGTQNDLFDGGIGNDTFTSKNAADGADAQVGGAGTDTATYASRTGAVTIVLDGLANDGSSGGAEGDNVGTDVEKVTSGKGGDTIDGGTVAVANTFKGGAGADTLLGRGGNDTLDTRDNVSGNDTADGGDGTDTCLRDAGDTALNCEA